MRLNEYDVTELLRLLYSKEITSRDIAVDLKDAIGSREPGIRAYLEVFDEDPPAPGNSRSISSSGKPLKLYGIPIAVKDNICIRGKKTACASRILSDYISPYNANVIEKLAQAGACFSGRTNMDEFAMGSSTENSAIFATKNPWNPDFTPGGSSGGSAAAVAADTAIAALGSDTGGSIRQPASFCGVVGLKPTYGRVSRYGLIAFASSLDQIGPITKSVRDSALLISVISGRDPRDSTSASGDVPDCLNSLERGMEGLTVGVPWSFLEGQVDDEVKANFEALIRKLEDDKIPIVDASLPHSSYAVASYYIIANAEASSNLARYDGTKYGYRTNEFDDYIMMCTRSRTEGFGEEVKRRILLGTFVLSKGYYEEYYIKAQKVRSLIIGDFRDAFAKCDLIMLPTAPTPPFRMGEKLEDPLLMYLSDIFTVPANLAGLPAISVPSGLTKDRLPLGVQLIGRQMDEKTVLRGGYEVERVLNLRERAFG